MTNGPMVGQKRKRYQPPQEEPSIRIGKKLHHEIKEVHKAAKRAKTFETQKVVKKLKDLRKKDATSEDILPYEDELKSLKEVDHDAVGNTAFKTKFLKDQTLRENRDITAALAGEFGHTHIVPATAGTSLAKLQSRLLSSKILATQIVASLQSLKVVLDPALKQHDLDDAPYDSTGQLPSRPSKILKESEHVITMATILAKGPTNALNDVEGDPEGIADDEGWESDNVGGANLGGWESGSIDEGGFSEGNNADDNSSGEHSENDDEALQVRPTKATITKKAAANALKSSASVSTFLPSLSVGFTRGDSGGSDWSETEAKAADIEPKKNRRGQRARRAIWEKKFGRNANHKKKEAEEVTIKTLKSQDHASIEAGFNMATGRPSYGSIQTRSAGSLQRKRAVDANWSGHSTGTGNPSNVINPSVTRADKQARPLHPSWEAKRRLKEKESVAIVPSEGKKIKFS